MNSIPKISLSMLVLMLSCDHGVSPIFATRQLVFVSYGPPPKNGLFVVNVDGTGYSRLTPDSIYVNEQFDCSPTGESIVFVGDYDICTISKNDRNVRFLTTGPDWDDAPTWTSDGGSIIFRSNRTGKFAIWMCNSDGSNPRQLAPDTAETWWPMRIPNTNRVAFVYIGPPNRLAIINTDGTGLQILTPDSLSVHDHFSPSFDGAYIAFAANDGRLSAYDLFTVNLIDGKIVQQTTNGSTYPYASPYSHEILYSTSTHLILRNFLDGSTGSVATLSVPPSRVAWMPNQRTIAFEGSSNPMSIYMLTLGGNAQPWKLTKSDRTEIAPQWNTSQW